MLEIKYYFSIFCVTFQEDNSEVRIPGFPIVFQHQNGIYYLQGIRANTCQKLEKVTYIEVNPYRLFFFRSTKIYTNLTPVLQVLNFRTICVNLRKSDKISHDILGLLQAWLIGDK